MSDNSDFSYVRKTYAVPACFGRLVIVHGRSGIIAEDRGHYIGVNFDHQKAGQVSNCHPTDEVEYFGLGEIRKMTRSQARYSEYLDTADFYDNFKHFLQFNYGKKEG